jgi:hypothetical protein
VRCDNRGLVAGNLNDIKLALEYRENECLDDVVKNQERIGVPNLQFAQTFPESKLEKSKLE